MPQKGRGKDVETNAKPHRSFEKCLKFFFHSENERVFDV